jgi:fructan beta-fructosidase
VFRHFVLLLAISAPTVAAERPDILVADFESKDYGNWKTTGEAFGPGPARGTLPNQMPVTGFMGKGLVNSYFGGDKSTGTLTSPAIKIERHFINFLVGGGKHAGETCINLLIDGKVVRTATGPNDKPGGSEELDWHAWDVKEFEGEQAVIEIVDKHTGGWGHINVDHILHSDTEKQPKGPLTRQLTVSKRYLLVPVKTGAPKRVVSIADGKDVIHQFDVELAEGEPSFWAFVDAAALKGKALTIEARLPGDSKALDRITQGDEINGEALYAEKQRPQFHFTSRRGWLNDPNGLVFHDGEWHLFYQHNPYGWDWGNMHWGHAVSKDLVCWKELPIALYPKKYGDWAFSGSAVVDRDNTSGFGTAEKPTLVAAFTSTGRGECIVYSTDRGRTWQEFDGNPVVKHAGRDPRLLWHAASKQWAMAVYDEAEGKRWIAFHTSPDLKKWTYRSRIEGYFECPDLFELPVAGKKGESKWVLYAADGKYALGSFDGQEFKPDGGKHTLWHGNFYAAQTFSNVPDGRRIQIGWGQGITFPEMPFNQQMTVPCRLTLRASGDGARMVAEPVKELESLRGEKHRVTDVTLKPGENPLNKVKGELLDIVAELHVGDAEAVGLTVRGTPITFDVKKLVLTCKHVSAPLKLDDGVLKLRILVDRGSIEIFAQDGAMAMSVHALAPAENKSVEAFARGGSAKIKTLDVFEMKSAWGK